MTKKDFLLPQLLEIPYFRALIRAVEAGFYQDIPFDPPMLDLGCGDGHFASHAFERAPDVGLDIWKGPLRKAARLDFYPLLTLAEGGRMPFHDSYFGSVVSNSVLEHIPELDPVLSEIARVLKPGGRLVFSVPNHNFLPFLSVGRSLDRLGLAILGDGYRAFFNRISRHHHCDPPDVWEDRLGKAGFQIERWWHYFSPAALRTLEWGHYFALPNAIIHLFTRRWVLVPSRWNVAFAHRLVRRHYEEPGEQAQGTYTFYITRRKDPP